MGNIGIGRLNAAMISWPGGISSIGDLISNVLPIIYGLAGIILFGLILYGGFMWLLSSGDPDKIRKATDTILNAAIGIAIVVFAVIITRIISGVIGIQLLP